MLYAVENQGLSSASLLSSGLPSKLNVAGSDPVTRFIADGP
jgi:hypothetical protein